MVLTLNGPLEERLAGLTGRHAVVITRGEVSTHQAQLLRPHGSHLHQIVASQDGVDLHRENTEVSAALTEEPNDRLIRRTLDIVLSF